MSGNANGIFRDYAVYVSQDGSSWGDPVHSGTGPNTRQVQVVPLAPKVGRYLKIVVTSSHGAVTGAASVAELNVQGKPIGAQITKQAWDLAGADLPDDRPRSRRSARSWHQTPPPSPTARP